MQKGIVLYNNAFYTGLICSLSCVLSCIFVSIAFGGTTGANYNMNRLLNEPHPFENANTEPRPDFSVKTGIIAPINNRAIIKSSEILRERKIVPNQSFSNNKRNNIVSEIRVGALWHDQGPFSHRKEEGYDGNLEILFNSPDEFKRIWSPKPHLGVSLNDSQDTNQVYAGLTWEWLFKEIYFTNFSLGGAYHDGSKVTDLTDQKSLGCKFLFRESLDIGYRFEGRHSIMAHLDHISNAKLCSTNEGLESVGIRYGYHF